ncbi:hypothetical protein FOQG_17802 [Fusarium oxysporum f. sp. raphani 54005]|uniref:Uncharacterized protein n=3 Tax=Fusarium oxysporum TaxID=5507 RepID=X0BG74_FUSOX|nr:hypothetical protein FOQG_17802 [Fusarium oxysporum f. sp. raphani 54005]EXL67025.1 hypothetical protein FOPG_16829 [Fusarium oxysporum f. sp. conglutinans race 2 54008]EXM13527.1 hypothetical protein FOTG_18018 [Fusarium oxysporum f. sp. vasinfectum 25433]
MNYRASSKVLSAINNCETTTRVEQATTEVINYRHDLRG